jgi:hypothetical protein
LEGAQGGADLPASRGDRVGGLAESRRSFIEMMPTLSIAIVAGARTNFMKIAPIIRVLQAQADDPVTADKVSGYLLDWFMTMRVK